MRMASSTPPSSSRLTEPSLERRRCLSIDRNLCADHRIQSNPVDIAATRPGCQSGHCSVSVGTQSVTSCRRQCSRGATLSAASSVCRSGCRWARTASLMNALIRLGGSSRFNRRYNRPSMVMLSLTRISASRNNAVLYTAVIMPCRTKDKANAWRNKGSLAFVLS